VETLFSQHGKLKDVRLVTHKNGASKGIAFVEFESAEEAAKAVLKTDGLTMGHMEISVAISCPPVRGTPLAQRESTFTPTLGGGKKDFGIRKARTQLAMVPRALQKAPPPGVSKAQKTPSPGVSSGENGSGTQNGSEASKTETQTETQKRLVQLSDSTASPSTESSTGPMSNDDFRKLLLQKK
jgi:RNA recognition motif-containing protein